jgi:glyoxylase-like metal-dependent hydrolase (beta-lactamase superfamily II)
MLDRISDRVFADVSGKFGGNFGLVVLDDQVVFIDSGQVHTYTSSIRDWALSEFSLPITKVIFTHYHSDHVFGAQGLGDVSRIGSARMREICTKNLETNWRKEAIIESMRSRKEIRPELWNAVQTIELKLPDIIFEQSLKVGNKGEIAVRITGGHTGGSSVVSIEPEHILFIGDLIFHGTFPYAGDPTSSPDMWIQGLQEIIKEDYPIIIPGHGAVCDNQELQAHVDFFTALRKSVRDAISQRISTDEFLESGLLPSHYAEGLEQRAPSTIKHYYDFYGMAEKR